MSSALLSYEEAVALTAACATQFSRFRPAVQRVELGRASGRILARPLSSDRDQPPFARSTRDGFACRAIEASAGVPLAIAGACRA